MNYKAARCSMHCFDNSEKSLHEVNTCLRICREGISSCQTFAHTQQKDAQEALEKCQQEARAQENLTDPIIHWASCYEKLILRFGEMESAIEGEFDNYV